MDIVRLHWIIVVTAALVLSPSSSASAAPAAIPESSLMDGRLVVRVLAGGAGPFRLRLDTGASRTVISDRLAAAIGAPRVGTTLVVTHAGRVRQPLAFVGGLQAGCFAPADVVAAVVPLREIDATGRVDGLLGQDVLAVSVYTLDYDLGRVVCHAPGDVVEGRRLPLSIESGRPLVSVPAGGGLLSLVADSGADRLVLLGDGALPDLDLTPLDTVAVRSVAGVRLARRVLVRGFGPDGADREGLLVTSDSAGRWMGDGLLPLHPFGRVTLDGPGGWLIVGTSR